MPYTAEHKLQTRRRIVASARSLFNRHGFSEVSIDDVMERAGLTRGGFYNHFGNKEALFVEAITAYESCNPTANWDGVELDFDLEPDTVARQMVHAYLSEDHLDDVDAQCPLVALPSEVAHAGPEVRQAYQNLLQKMIAVFEDGIEHDGQDRALALTAMCVGAMLVGRTISDQVLAKRVLSATKKMAGNQLAG